MVRTILYIWSTWKRQKWCKKIAGDVMMTLPLASFCHLLNWWKWKHGQAAMTCSLDVGIAGSLHGVISNIVVVSMSDLFFLNNCQPFSYGFTNVVRLYRKKTDDVGLCVTISRRKNNLREGTSTIYTWAKINNDRKIPVGPRPAF